MNDDENYSDRPVNASKAKLAVGYRYAGYRTLKDGRIRLDRVDGAGITLSVEEWERYVADFFMWIV